MRYAIARFNQHQRDLAYRIYITDCLRITTENTAKSVLIASHGEIDASAINVRFADYFKNETVDNRTADDIIEGIRKKL